MSYYPVRRMIGRTATSALRCLPAETAHHLGMNFMKWGVHNLLPAPPLDFPVGMKVSVPGLGAIPHPVGLAAGFDKNAKCPGAFVDLGFSFIEVGTVTPLPQPGNPKPRLFRQKESLSLINRMGFNNDGSQAIRNRLQNSCRNLANSGVPLGVNIGKNKNTPLEKALDDYIEGIRVFKDIADYIVINISSPNTPGLRQLSSKRFINDLASVLTPDERNSLKIWFKLDPDMSRDDLQNTVEAITDQGFGGIILTNTHRVTLPEPGGMSGHPLAIASTKFLEWAYEVHRGQLSMIASGGVLSGVDVYQKMIRGAGAVQLYSALVYRGMWAVHEILSELADEMAVHGVEQISDIIGSYYGD